MQNPYDDILFFDDLGPAQQEALRAALDEDPALAEAFAQWQQVRAAVRWRLHADLPDRRLLVLFALEVSGRADALTEEEKAGLAAARAALDTALQAHPALADVVAHVDDCCADFDAAWEAQFGAEERPVRRAAPDRQARQHLRRGAALRWGWRAVASVAVVAFVAVLILMVQRDRSLTTVRVAEGQTRVIELADGSTVRLLGGSTLAYADPSRSAAFNRRVWLEGRAFFDVAASQQGFIVEMPTALTTVLGTSFGIRADEAGMEVVLASGRISVAAKAAQDQIVVLEPGQMSRVARNALPSTPALVELSRALAWTGLFIFRSTPVAEVVARLSEYYDVEIAVPPALESEGFNGTFEHDQPLEQILNALATTLNASVQGSAGEGYRLVSAAQR